jgi:hypothetical protein
MLTGSKNVVLLSLVIAFCTFAQAPAVPVLVSPINGASNVPCSYPWYGIFETATFTWDLVVGAISYTIEIGTSSTFASVLINVAGITTTSYEAVGSPQTCNWCGVSSCNANEGGCIKGGATYYWHVGAAGQSGTSWSVTDSFSTDVGPVSIISGLKTFSVSLRTWTTKNSMNYSLPARCFVSINLYNAQGRLLTPLVNRMQEEGNYSCQISGLGNGAFLLAFQAGNYQCTKTILATH